MIRPKQSSRILQKAQLRASGLQAIDPNIDFGNANSLQNMQQQMEQLRNKLNSHNTALAVINATKTDIAELEKSLSALCETMLMAVAVKYGKDSIQYEMAGGVRKSDRIRKGTITRLKTVAEKATIESLEGL